jgi:hypothetical protein
MNSIILLILFNIIVTFSQTLRGTVEILNKQIIKKEVRKMFNIVYWKTIEKVIQNKSNHTFTLYCEKQKPAENILNCLDGYKLWKVNNNLHDIVIFNISIDLITANIINKIALEFSDANITTYNKNCCNYYNISW